MSRRTDNRHRAATICREATGLPHHLCMRWAKDGLITRRQPVPDTEHPGQLTLEAELFGELAEALPAEHEDGAVLGLTRVRPSGASLVLGLRPERADTVLAAVLPRIDASGAVRGVPGLRLVPHGGEWWLTRAADAAFVRLVHPRPGWEPLLPGHGDGLTQLWRSHRHGLHPAETARLMDRATEGAAVDRDRLFSRLLRRLGLINQAGARHGYVNLSTEGRYDLAVACCCGSEATKLVHGLRQSGLAAPAGATGADDADDAIAYAGVIQVGEACVSVLHASCGSYPTGLPGLRWATC